MSAASRRTGMSWPALIGVTIGAIVMAAPLIWTLMLSLKNSAELMRDSGAAFSAPYTLENYQAILAGSSVFRWLLNSIIVSIGTTLGVLALCSLAGYGFARLDFWTVLLPLTLPAQATLGVFTFLASWNSYWWPLISATRSDMYTLTVGLAASQMNYAQTSGLGFLMAQAVFASIPILIVYLIFQKQIVRAMAGTAVR